MKVYVKKDKVLRLLGEGKVYSKKDLVLKEMTGGEPLIGDVTANDEQLQGSTGLENAVNKQVATHPAADGFSTELGNLKQSNSSQQKGNGVMSFTQDQLKDPNTKKLIDNAATTNPNMQVNIMKGNSANGVQLASVAPKKVMDEMRENSIPFTKSELTEFLKSL